MTFWNLEAQVLENLSRGADDRRSIETWGWRVGLEGVDARFRGYRQGL